MVRAGRPTSRPSKKSLLLNSGAALLWCSERRGPRQERTLQHRKEHALRVPIRVDHAYLTPSITRSRHHEHLVMGGVR